MCKRESKHYEDEKEWHMQFYRNVTCNIDEEVFRPLFDEKMGCGWYMQTMLNIPASDILLSSEQDLVNKDPFSEMFAGLELMKYSDCLRKSELYYWQHMSKNGKAEVDYLVPMNGRVLPIEVKASTKCSMQSLYLFMRKRHLEHAVRTSLENFGRFEYDDPESKNEIRHVDVIPLYALSNL